MKSRTPFLACAVAACALAAPARAAYVEPAVIDSAPLSINDIAVAPDGTGALVYLKTVGADDRVFVSILAGGTWGAPFPVDTDTGDDESSPRVAAANGGRVLVGYRDGNGQFLRFRLKDAGGSDFGAQGDIRAAAAAAAIQNDWDLDMNPAGVAYAAWAEKNPATMKNDARAWRLEGASGSLVAARLQKNPDAEDVLDGGNGPDIRVGVDDAGNGAVMFGQTEGATDAAYLRRLAGTTASATHVAVHVPQVLGENRSAPERQLDLDLAGNGLAWASGTAMYTAGGHGIGVPVTGESPGPFAVLDAYDALANDNVERTDVALNATGQGLFASEPNLGQGIFGGTLTGASASAATRLDSSPHDGAASEVPAAAIGDNGRGLVAWTRDVGNGAAGPFEVRGNYWNGTAFEGETLMAMDAKTTFPLSQADGAGASRHGDVAVLAEREVAGVKSVIVARFDAPPTAPSLTSSPGAATLTWAAAEDLWSGITSYRVVIDEAIVATVGSDVLSHTPSALAAGDHTWRVVAVDALGQETTSATQTFTVAAAQDPTDPTDPTDPNDPTDPTGPGPADTTSPVISRLRQSHDRWRVGRKPTPTVAAGVKLPIGTTFRMRLSEAATVTIAFQRLRPGRRVGNRCVAPKRSLRSRPRCTRRRAVGRLTRTAAAGRVAVLFSGRIGSRALRPGRYRAVFTARDAAGNGSAARTLRFRIVRG